MKAVALASSALCLLFTSATGTALGQGLPRKPATIVCPTTVAVGVTPGPSTEGWSSIANVDASFKGAQVISSVGLTPPTLACTYTLAGQALEITRLTRPEPAGMLCTVNAKKDAQFDCFPRPGPESTPPPSH
jgi:hypothetical protein